MQHAKHGVNKRQITSKYLLQVEKLTHATGIAATAVYFLTIYSHNHARVTLVYFDVKGRFLSFVSAFT